MAADPLAKACELAFEVARQGVETDPPVDPPASMRSFLYVAQLPPRAVSVAQRVIDSDGAFRARVAAQATESSVGEPGYLWLTRPDGWQSAYSSLTGSTAPSDGSIGVASPAVPPPPPAPGSVRPAPAAAAERPTAPVVATPAPAPAPAASQAPPPSLIPAAGSVSASAVSTSAVSTSDDASSSSDEIETELSSLRNLVDQLAEERETVGTASASLTAPVESPRTETPTVAPSSSATSAPSAPSAPSSSALTRQLDALTADLRRARTERDEALTEKETSIARQLILEDELATLQTDITGLRSSLLDSQQSAGELQSQVTNLMAERQSATELAAERDELAKRVTVAEQARVDLETELSEVSAKWQDAQVELNSVVEQRAAIEVELTKLRTTRSTLDAENDAMLADVSTQLGEVRAERDLLAAKLETTQTHLSATRAAVENASAGIRSELELTEMAVGEAADRSGALDVAVRNTSQRLADFHATKSNASLTEPSVDTDSSAVAKPSTEAEASAEPDIAAPVEKPLVDEPSTIEEPTKDVGLPTITDSPTADPTSDLAAAETTEDVSVFGSPPPADTPSVEEDVETPSAKEAAAAPSASPFDEPDTIPVSHAAGFVADPVHPVARAKPDGPVVDPSIARQQIPPMSGDPVSVARHAVSTPDVVVLIHGDPVALLGWPTLDVGSRRDALVSYLSDLAADTGAAPDVVFDGSVGNESDLPTSRVVRVRLTNVDVDAESAVAPLVASYPKQWPVAVVTDSPALAEEARQLGASVVENGHMLDLFISN